MLSRVRMQRFYTLFLSALFAGGLFLPAYGADFRPSRELQAYVWEYPLRGFSEADYKAGVETLFRVYEKHADKSLQPGERGRVGIKVYTASAPGLSTPPHLTHAVIQALEERGFKRESMMIVDMDEGGLRRGGYLQRAGSGDNTFRGVPVHALNTGDYYNANWYYDSNLPSRERLAQTIANSRMEFQADPEERRSYLAAPLLLDVDFWINLPMVADSPALGVSGAIANATLWSVSNNQRFFASPANAPVAAAEIAGIPELRSTWAMTIMTLERYQYMGGPRFNAMYSEEEPRLWMSVNPAALDYLMWQRIKRLKESHRFPVDEQDPPLFEYAKAVGLGPYVLSELKLRRLAPAQP